MDTETRKPVPTGSITFEAIGELSIALLDIVPDSEQRHAVMGAVITAFQIKDPDPRRLP